MVTGDLNAALVEWVVQYRTDRSISLMCETGQMLRDHLRPQCAKLW